jgi:hypothetical protein
LKSFDARQLEPKFLSLGNSQHNKYHQTSLVPYSRMVKTKDLLPVLETYL